MFSAATLFPDTAIAGEGDGASAQPNTISGLQMWLKADSLSLVDNDPVVTWTDASGNGNSPTQATSGKRPIFHTGGPNGKPYVQFDGTDDELIATLPSAMQTDSYTYFAVFQSSAANRCVLELGDTATQDHFLRTHATTSKAEAGAYRTGGIDQLSSTTSVQTASTYFIVTVRRSTTDGNLKIYVNGVLENTVTLGNATADYGTTKKIAVGSRNGSAYTTGKVPETFHYSSDLSDANRLLLENYLGNKYTIAVGANKKIFDVIQASTTDTTCAFGTTATQRYIIAKPGVANSTSATPAAAQDVGFNIRKSDMNNTAGTPNKRKILTGTWTFHCVLDFSTADTSSVFSIKAYVHRRSSTGVLTELFNAESATLIGVKANVTWTKTGVAQQLFDTDETLHIEYWVQGRGGGTTGVIAQTVTFITGPTSLFQNVDFVLPSVIATEFYRTHTKTARGIVTLQKKTNKPFTKTARGIVTIRKQINKPFLKTARGIVTLQKFTTKSFVKTARGIVTLTKRTNKAFTQTARGDVALQKQTNKFFTKTAQGIVTFERRLSAYRSFTVTARGIVTLQKMTSKFFTKTARGIVTGFLGRPFGEIPDPGSGGGGGETSSTFIK